MTETLAGRIVCSVSGHDSGRLYIVLRTEGRTAFLSDGRLRPKEKPKKKNIRHLKVLAQEADGFCHGSVGDARNEEIRRVLKIMANRLSTSIQEE